MKIVSFKICPFVQRVIGVLELKQVSFEVEFISLMDKPDWFLAASPNGQVPILIEPSGVLFESGPISEYVDEAYGDFRLHPEDPFQRAQHRAWIELAASNYLVQCRTQRSTDNEDLQKNQQIFSTALQKIQAALGGGPYFAGNNLSLVDTAWFVLLHRAHLIEQCTGFDFLSEFAEVKRWQQALLDVESLRRSAPQGFVEEFANFYLNEHTYLGQLMQAHGGQCGASGNASCDADTLTACCR